MQVIKRYNQHRRDLHIDMECENCKNKETYTSAYDDYNFWANVVPNFKCKKCDKSSNDLNIAPKSTATMYPEGYQI